jgi:hypothetical protein
MFTTACWTAVPAIISRVGVDGSEGMGSPYHSASPSFLNATMTRMTLSTAGGAGKLPPFPPLPRSAPPRPRPPLPPPPSPAGELLFAAASVSSGAYGFVICCFINSIYLKYLQLSFTLFFVCVKVRSNNANGFLVCIVSPGAGTGCGTSGF